MATFSVTFLLSGNMAGNTLQDSLSEKRKTKSHRARNFECKRAHTDSVERENSDCDLRNSKCGSEP
jgi:hypothetical protein